MSELPDRPRTSKKSKGKKKKPAAAGGPGLVGTLLIIAALGGIVAGAIALGQYLGQPPGPPPAPQWPPPVGTPRDKLFGDHPGDTIVPPTEANYQFPLRRRFCDPWIQISNLQAAPPKGGEREVKFDLKVVTSPDPLIAPRLHVEFPAQQADPNHFAVSPPQFFRITGFQEAIQRGRGTVTLSFPLNRFASSQPLNIEGAEIYLITAMSAGGKFPRQPIFKVSPSLFIGSGGQPHSPREWKEDEVDIFTGWNQRPAGPGAPPGDGLR